MTSPTQGEHAQTEALYLAACFDDNTSVVGAKRIAAEFRRLDAENKALHAQVAALTAQPAAPQGVAYAELPAPPNNDPDAWVRFWLDSALRCPGFEWDGDQREMAEDQLRAAVLRASHGQAPAGAAREPTAFIHWPIDGPPRLVWYSQKALNDAILKTYEGHQPDVKLYTAQAAPAAGAVAGPTDATRNAWQQGYAQGVASALPSKVTPDMRRVFREGYREGGFWSDRLDYALEKMLAAAPTPAAQADSQPAPQGETNVQLDTDSNPSAPGQHRDMVGSVALGQPMGNGQDQAAGHSGAQGDKLLTVAERNIRSFLRSAIFKSESDREAALSCVDVLRDAARAQADSVLEDAALLDWQASARVEVSPEYEGPWHAAAFGEDEKPVFLASGNTPREALIAARKQGGKHD